MFYYDPKEYSYRNAPWERPIESRIQNIKNAKALKKKTVAFFYPRFDSSTFRYRGYNVVETLEYSFQWSGSYFEVEEVGQVKKILDDIDIVVFIRCEWDFEMEDFVKELNSKGIQTAYDVDDLIYSCDYISTIIKTLGLQKGFEWNHYFGLVQRNYMLAKICDTYITTNDYLAERLRRDFGKPCYIIKNYLNWIQEAVSKDLFELKKEKEAKKPFLIGYFSGSPTHVKDLMIVLPEIEAFVNKYENTRLRIVGYMELPEQYQYLVEEGKIDFVPFQTFVGLQVEQAQVDINIVPLVNNEFSNCKSELKYFETAIVGVPTCATPTFAYKTAIEHGVNGYLCEKGEWLPVFEKIYKEGVSWEYREFICQKALEQYGSKSQLTHIEDVFDKIYEKKGSCHE